MTEEKIEMENPKVVTNFISRYQNLVIHEADSKEALAKFYPIGNKKGGFATDDPEVIKKLTNRSDHGSGKGKAFSILKDRMPSFEDESIQKGAATSSDKQQIEAIKKNLEEQKKIELSIEKDKLKTDIGQMYMRFGQLKAMLLNKDGEYRKDATDELKEEFEQLKKNIEV